MDENSFMERRRYPRAPVQVEVICVEAPATIKRGKALLVFVSENISMGGMLFKSTLLLEIGAIIHLKFTLPVSSKEIITQAKVLRTEKYEDDEQVGIAVEFEHMGFEDKTLIDTYVKGKIE